MPLLFHRNRSPAGELGVWETTEAEAFFRSRLPLTTAEVAYMDSIPGAGRRKEWVASRYLLHRMSGREVRGAVFKDEYGKPHLADSDWQISLSHTRRYVAVIAGPELCGVDIQVLVPKIERLAPKFMRPEESASLQPATRLEHLHVYWGAKEALYKAYGRRQLDFRDHLFVQPFDYRATGGQTTGAVVKDDLLLEFTVAYERIGDTVLVTAG